VSRIDFFNLVSADTLTKCYDAFPQAISMDSRHLDELTGQMTDIPQEHRVGLWADSIRWLNQEGFIHYRNEGFENRREESRILMLPSFGGVTLAGRGFQALRQSLPGSVEPGRTVGDAIRDELADTGRQAAQGTLGDLIGQVIGGAVRGWLG
jgi:hypothetical protein